MSVDNLEARGIALIVTRPDGSQTCPIYTSGEDPILCEVDSSKINVTGNTYLQKLVEKEGPNAKAEVKDVTWKELVAQGLRTNPNL